MPARLSQTIPASVDAVPDGEQDAPSGSARSSRGIAMATAKFTSDIGRNPSPACSGVKPRASCM